MKCLYYCPTHYTLPTFGEALPSMLVVLSNHVLGISAVSSGFSGISCIIVLCVAYFQQLQNRSWIEEFKDQNIVHIHLLSSVSQSGTSWAYLAYITKLHCQSFAQFFSSAPLVVPWYPNDWCSIIHRCHSCMKLRNSEHTVSRSAWLYPFVAA